MATHTQSANGLQFSRRIPATTFHVFDQFEYDYRSSVIRNPSGESYLK
jgi:ribonucleoside-diphosphate reductase alpha chain